MEEEEEVGGGGGALGGSEGLDSIQLLKFALKTQ